MTPEELTEMHQITARWQTASWNGGEQYIIGKRDLSVLVTAAMRDLHRLEEKIKDETLILERKP